MAAGTNIRQILGLEDLAKMKVLSAALLAEFLGTAILVLIGCGSCITGWDLDYSPTIVQIALAFGVTVGTVVQFIGHVSGGHINPAVTLGFLVTKKISLFRAMLYVIVQCLGAIVGAGLLKGLTPSNLQGNLGATVVNQHLSPVQGFVVELCITFVLVFTVFACCDENRGDIKGSAPLAIGLSVATCHMFAIKYTGASMNTARSFGPAVVANVWSNHWVYWIGPILGGVIAALLYQFIFSAPTPPSEESEYAEKVELREKQETPSV
ncbi:aquaporin AQPAe.a-like [Limulus polyphemus]|uniref:Aquaporin AQPAe.a-like n=1 Tax=Limulus polyphemus TaxID=6850 RepID=A0ABM1BNR7_LIMPO|nr:aquaporin AQPAe.a-like [Limulus polyphemus]